MKRVSPHNYFETGVNKETMKHNLSDRRSNWRKWKKEEEMTRKKWNMGERNQLEFTHVGISVCFFWRELTHTTYFNLR